MHVFLGTDRHLQVADMRFSSADWAAAPVGKLRLGGVRLCDLPALLAVLRPPTAGPIESLMLFQLRVLEEAAAIASAVQACAPHLEHVRELDVCSSDTLNVWGWPRLLAALEPLLRQLPRLETLHLTHCNLSTLPAGPYLTGETTLALDVFPGHLVAGR